MAEFDVAENRSLDALNASEGLLNFNHTFWMGDMGEMEPLSPVTLVLVSVWSGVIFLVGILGNLSVGLAVWGNRELRTPTNFFLLNLSVADLLLLLFCLPVYVVELWVHFPWLLGETMCKLAPFIEVLVLQLSILTIMAVSVDRYRGVCRALQAQATRRLRGTAVTIAAAWGLSLLTSSPMLVFVKFSTYHVNGSSVEICEMMSLAESWKDVYAVAVTVMFFVVPFLILSSLYSLIIRRLVRRASDETSGNFRHQQQARRRVIRMLIVVVLVFFLCMLPNRVFHLWMLFAPQESIIALGSGTVMKLIVFMRSLAFLNSCINPIIYSLFSTRFRSTILNCCRGPPVLQGRHLSASSAHTGNPSRIVLPELNVLWRGPDQAAGAAGGKRTRHRLALAELPSLRSFPVSDESDSGSVVYIRKWSFDWVNLKETAL
ncbi:PREDICTED: growth hormone secretagogue receptor type 1-like [Branchiostoma belcheri]|uniref:Growth hormone secretagogue receptor type 1-like n=1 Tax=Branchiostoma belcheri TaxID=7741 RepID=A0A6P4ZBY3_BRABE|nr:PREDICTED: growth hormone secretagogue receptor type 1-like [Branchiostoma belcheri]